MISVILVSYLNLKLSIQLINQVCISLMLNFINIFINELLLKIFLELFYCNSYFTESRDGFQLSKNHCKKSSTKTKVSKAPSKGHVPCNDEKIESKYSIFYYNINLKFSSHKYLFFDVF